MGGGATDDITPADGPRPKRPRGRLNRRVRLLAGGAGLLLIGVAFGGLFGPVPGGAWPWDDERDIWCWHRQAGWQLRLPSAT
jgi:hypothetical protein